MAQLPRREHERDLFRDEAARHKCQGARGRGIEPLHVVNGTQKWLLLRGLGQQAKDRQSDQERIWRGSRSQPERDLERAVLRLRQGLHQLKERSAQLLSRRERELHLRLDPDSAGDPKLGCSLDRILEQRCLADARLAIHHQCLATSGANAV